MDCGCRYGIHGVINELEDIENGVDEFSKDDEGLCWVCEEEELEAEWI